MTASRVACPGRILPHDRHFATATRWIIMTPANETIVTCSAACALDWLVKALPAGVSSAGGNTDRNTDEVAA